MWTFRLGADCKRVIYKADPVVVGRRKLFSVPVDGSLAPVQPNQTPVSGSVQTYLPEPRPDRQALAR